MTASIILWTYRATVTLLATSPIALNAFFNQNIITSLLYVPLASLILVGLAMALDSVLEEVLQPSSKKVNQKDKAIVEVLPEKTACICNKFHRAA